MFPSLIVTHMSLSVSIASDAMLSPAAEWSRQCCQAFDLRIQQLENALAIAQSSVSAEAHLLHHLEALQLASPDEAALRS